MLANAEVRQRRTVNTERAEGACSSPMGTILSHQPERRFRAGEHLFHEGDCERSIFLIERGLVRLYKILSDGRRQIIAFRFPGDVFGSDMLAEQYCSAEAVTDVALRSLSGESAHRRMKEQPELTSDLLRLLSSELANTRSQITVLNRRSAIEKLSAFILDLCRRNGAAAGLRNRVALELSRTDIADFLGLTIETVSRNLTKLRKRGIIDLPEVHTMLVLDRQRLEDLAAGDCTSW